MSFEDFQLIDNEPLDKSITKEILQKHTIDMEIS